MASCGYSLLLENAGNCGVSPEYLKQNVFLTLSDCQRDISDHLKFCKISGKKDLDSEMKLLLVRAGRMNGDCLIYHA
jgi:hypothetical protein